MKKFLLLSVVIIASIVTVNAQIRKETIFLGGDLSASTQKVKDGSPEGYKNHYLNFSPTAGKFIKDNLVVGGSLHFSISSSDATAIESHIDNKAYGAGVFVRKYRNIGNSGFYIFIQAGADFIHSHNESQNSVPEINVTKGLDIGVNVYPGVAYAISKRVYLEAGFNNLVALNYSRTRLGEDPFIYKSNSFGLSSSISNISSNLFLGFRLMLGKQ